MPGAHTAAPPGTYALVGGTTAVFADIQRAVNHDYAVVFPVAAVIILLILLNARQNLRQHKYAAILEKLTRPG